MLVSFVSDGYDVALSDVSVELRCDWARVATSSPASGAIVADVEPGTYEGVLVKDGYRTKTATVSRAFLNEIYRERRPSRLGVPPGLPASSWPPARAVVVEDHGLSPVELEALDGVITGSVAIADSGTLSLAGGLAEGRRVLVWGGGGTTLPRSAPEPPADPRVKPAEMPLWQRPSRMSTPDSLGLRAGRA